MDLKAPIITGMNEDQLNTFKDFLERLKAGHVPAAAAEAERIAPYLSALSAQLGADATAGGENTPTFQSLTSPQSLTRLFNTVAARTSNTILSEIIVLPEGLLKHEDVKKSATQFNATMKYGDTSFLFGFLQIFTGDNIRTSAFGGKPEGADGSISIPLLALKDEPMEALAPFAPETLLRAMQTIATAGNHDMLHHYTNTVLNTNISNHTVLDDMATPVAGSSEWSSKYFTSARRDSDTTSYESWLMLEHLRVRTALDAGPEGEKLAEACETFFTELERIGHEIALTVSPEKAHETVDYVGSAMLFAMMRYMPLDDPILTHAIDRLQQADPLPDLINEQKEALLGNVAGATDRYIKDTIENYKARGVSLLPAKPGYAALKKLQMIMIVPWIAHLLSPAQAGSSLEQVKSGTRVGNANVDMIKNSASGIWFEMENGQYTFTLKKGDIVEVYLEDGHYARPGGDPAKIVTRKDGSTTKEWYDGGKLYRGIHTEENGDFTERWIDKETKPRASIYSSIPTVNLFEAPLHRDDGGPAMTRVRRGVKEEEWHINGLRHRDGAPAILQTAVDGTPIAESWYRKSRLHREDGPAKTTYISATAISPDKISIDLETSDLSAGSSISQALFGTSKPPAELHIEEWYIDGQPHRDGDLPAVTKTAADGTVVAQTWYMNGSMQRADGPANLQNLPDGTHIEEWVRPATEQEIAALNNTAPEPEDPLFSPNIKPDLWPARMAEPRKHRDSGPAVIKTKPDGSATEEWWMDGNLHRIDGGPAVTKIKTNGSRLEEWWVAGKKSRNDGPASINTEADGTYEEKWLKDGQAHRADGGPAVIKTKANGYHREEWWVDGKKSRDDGPASIRITADGAREEEWLKDGKPYRADGGPTHVRVLPDGTVEDLSSPAKKPDKPGNGARPARKKKSHTPRS